MTQLDSSPTENKDPIGQKKKNKTKKKGEMRRRSTTTPDK
jgi:hypothetical protein